MALDEINSTSSQPLNISDEVANMNMEITYFLQKFKSFQHKTNVINRDLKENLEYIIDSIEEFIDSSPKICESEESSKTISFQSEGLNKEYFCSVCKETIPNSMNAISKHIEKQNHKENIKASNYIRFSLNKSRVNIEKFQNEMKTKRTKYEEQVLPRKAKVFLGTDIVQSIQQMYACGMALRINTDLVKAINCLNATIKSSGKNIIIYPFGPRVLGLEDKENVVNIFIDIDSSFYVCQPSPEDCARKLSEFKDILMKDSKMWKGLLENKKKMLLIASNALTGTKVSMSFTNGLPYSRSMLIKYFLESSILCHKLCIFMKNWTEGCSVHFQFDDYLICLMVIFYLQVNQLLPPIHILQTGCKPIFIGPWQINFESRQPLQIIQPNQILHSIQFSHLQFMQPALYPGQPVPSVLDTPQNLIYHVVSLLRFYESYNYEKFIICPYLGINLEKVSLGNSQKSPPNFARYKEYVATNELENLLPIWTPICIQDAFQLNENIAKDVSYGSLELFKRFCRVTLKIFKEKGFY